MGRQQPEDQCGGRSEVSFCASVALANIERIDLALNFFSNLLAAVARIDGDASVMSPLDAAGMAIKQQAVELHHPVNPLVIGRLQASGQRLALEDGVDTSVATP